MSRLATTLPTALVAAATVLVGAGGATLTAAPASAAPAVPPTPKGLPSGIEQLAHYVPASSCDARAKPGTVAFATMLKAATGVNYTIPRNCGADALSTSEHYDGRAVDWFTTVRNRTSRAKANAVISWLLAKDKAGNKYANARRLGVMYIIWNNRIWGAYRPSDGWRPYSSCASHPETSYDTTCHRNHMHISLSWEGAHKRTSWWTKRVARPEYGPCRGTSLNWALPRSSANHSPCRSHPKVTAASGAGSLGRTLVAYSGMYVSQGSTGPVVKAVQSAIGTTADGGFGPMTAAALKTWQTRHGVKATGRTDAATWRALIHPYLPGSGGGGTGSRGTTRLGTPGPGLDGDKRPDLLARAKNGTMYLYSGTGRGTLKSRRKVASGWTGMRTFFSPGDFTGDGRRDVIAVGRWGHLLLRTGTATGTFSAPKTIARGWHRYAEVFSPGDFTGDGEPDLLARDRSGQLWLQRGNGHGGLAGSRTRIGTGWKRYDTVFSAGDVTGDHRADLLARTPAGVLYRYRGNGTGGFTGGRVRLSSGWKRYTLLFGTGDLTGDGKRDLVARQRGGTLYLRAGNGHGGFHAPRRVGPGWQIYTRVVGSW